MVAQDMPGARRPVAIVARLTCLARVARTIAWPALLAGGVACAGAIALAGLAGGLSAQARWPGLAGLALCGGLAFLLDDAAGPTVGASPTSLARRRMVLIALVLPFACAVWAGSMWYATSVDGAPFGPDARRGLSLQFAAMLAVTLGASAAALRVMPGERGGWTAVVALLLLLVAAFYLPQRWALLAGTDDPGWAAAQQRWLVLLALGVLSLGLASRDPATSGRRARAARGRPLSRWP
jgi:hypothetical protein